MLVSENAQYEKDSNCHRNWHKVTCPPCQAPGTQCLVHIHWDEANVRDLGPRLIMGGLCVSLMSMISVDSLNMFRAINELLLWRAVVGTHKQEVRLMNTIM